MTKPILLDFTFPIRTSRLLIRPPLAGDGAALNEAVRETYPELCSIMPWAKTIPSLDDSEEFVRRAIANWVIKDNIEPYLPLFIFDTVTGLFLGSTGYHHMNWDVPALEIGYWLRTTQQKRGIMTEAVNAITRYAFQHLKTKRVEIRCDIQNSKSRKVAERLGYTLEATLKYNRINIATGEPSDTLVFASYSVEHLPKLDVYW